MAVLDGFGLTMFLPLLELVSGSGESNGEGLGGMKFLLEGFHFLHLPINLYTILAFLVVLFGLKGFVTFWKNYYDTKVRFFFMKKLRIYISDLFTQYTYQAFSSANIGRLQNSMTGELAKITNAQKAYLQTMQAYVMVLVYASLAAVSNFQFAIIVAVAVLLTNGFFRIVYKKTKASSGQLSRKDSVYHGYLIQFVNSFKYLKATGYIYLYQKRLKQAIISIEKENKLMGFYTALLAALREPLMVLVVCGVILFQTSVLKAPLGGIILSLLFFYRAMNNMIMVQTLWNSFLVNIGAIENIQDLIQDLKANAEPNGSEVLEHQIGSWDLASVSYYYGNTQVLKSVDLTIQSKSTVAIVGQSGSGKTTLVNMLCGLLTPKEGRMKIDQADIQNLDRKSYQRFIGYITQEPVIYDDTLYNNVTFWAEKSEQNLKRFYSAIEQAAVKEFMSQMPDAEDSRLGNNGIQLSGGQKQRISIARELYKEVQLLVMDEATSALDSETEKVIQSNIDRLKGTLTIVMVAHRLSTIKAADKICVMADGKIIDSGSYDGLLASSALFQKMINHQEL